MSSTYYNFKFMSSTRQPQLFIYYTNFLFGSQYHCTLWTQAIHFFNLYFPHLIGFNTTVLNGKDNNPVLLFNGSHEYGIKRHNYAPVPEYPGIINNTARRTNTCVYIMDPRRYLPELCSLRLTLD